jgi:methyl halide transferase
LNLDKKYWEEKYLNDETNWDIGYISTPLKEYFDQLENKNLKILIPGCGNAYEADYLFESGFGNVFLLDWSENVISDFKERVPNFPEENILIEDFFEHTDKYDLIIEQTFFCAIYPEKRLKYAKKVYDLLNKNGKLVGLLFNHEFGNSFPPYGGTKEEYLEYFKSFFQIKYFSDAYNSIKPRAGREYFINLIKL